MVVTILIIAGGAASHKLSFGLEIERAKISAQ